MRNFPIQVIEDVYTFIISNYNIAMLIRLNSSLLSIEQTCKTKKSSSRLVSAPPHSTAVTFL